MTVRVRVVKALPGIEDMPRLCQAWVGCEFNAEHPLPGKGFKVSIEEGAKAIERSTDPLAPQLLQTAVESFPHRLEYLSGDDFLFPADCCEIISESEPVLTE